MNETRGRWFATAIIGCAVVLAAMVGQVVHAGSMGSSQNRLLGASNTAEGGVRLPSLALDVRSDDLDDAGEPCIWYNGTRKEIRVRTAGQVATVHSRIAPTVVDSDALANPTSATAFSSKVSLPANYLAAGRPVRVTAWGKYTTGVGLTPTLTLACKIGATTVGSSGAVSTAASLTDKAWLLTSTAIVRTAGAGGTLVGVARGELGGLLAAAVPVAQAGRTGSTALNTTVANDVVVTALFGVSDAANSITCEGLLVE